MEFGVERGHVRHVRDGEVFDQLLQGEINLHLAVLVLAVDSVTLLLHRITEAKDDDDGYKLFCGWAMPRGERYTFFKDNVVNPFRAITKAKDAATQKMHMAFKGNRFSEART